MRARPGPRAPLLLAAATLVVAAAASTTIGVYAVPFSSWDAFWADPTAGLVIAASRVPRALAALLLGASLAIAGMVMQLLTRNAFVAPSTTGVVESASLGLLVVTWLLPSAPVLGKALVASAFALAGTALFLTVIRRVQPHTPLLVPLVGIVLGGIVGSVTTFFAYRLDFLQSLAAWTTGDFARALSGRYELLWVAGAATLLAFLLADRLTVAGLGADVATGLGLDHGRVLALGMTLAAVIVAVTVVSVGSVPFLGLIVPNVVRLMAGDQVRRTAPWVALGGAAFVLVCDVVGRVIRFPYEVPVGTVAGVLGSVVFLVLLLRSRARAD